jgi:hypothetical protein
MASWHTGYLAGREAQQLFRDIATQFHLGPDQRSEIAQAQDFISEMEAGLKEYINAQWPLLSSLTNRPRYDCEALRLLQVCLTEQKLGMYFSRFEFLPSTHPVVSSLLALEPRCRWHKPVSKLFNL